MPGRLAWCVSPSFPACASSKRSGNTTDAAKRWAAQTQELPSLLVLASAARLLQGGEGAFTAPQLCCTAMFATHYAFRALVYPFLLVAPKPTPLSVWALALGFCVYNGTLQALLILLLSSMSRHRHG